MSYCNEMSLIIDAISSNESFARSAVASFCLPLNPSIDEIMEIKTAVSEAVTNSIVHAYPLDNKGKIQIYVKLLDSTVYISIVDEGIGIENLQQAMQPFFTTKPLEDRTGMGFTVMESFMDSVTVFNNTSKKGVTVNFVKHIKGQEQIQKVA